MTTSRRAYGTGTIRRRGDRYQAIVRYYDASGKRHQKAQSFDRKTEAQRWIQNTNAAIGRTGPPSPLGRMTMSAFLSEWLDSSDLAGLAHNTQDWYRSAVERHLIPALGGTRLDRVTAVQLDTFLNHKRTEGRLDGKPGGLGTSSLRRLYVTLTKAFSYAERMGHIDSNPMKLVSTPIVERVDSTLKVWTMDQMRRFLSTVSDDHFYPLWHLAVWTGMRRGELLGLKWSDVDLDRGTLAIRRTRITTASGTAEVAPKTARGVRTVELDSGTISVLRQNRAQQAGDRLAAGSAWQETGLVFVWSDGRGPSPYWISHRFKVLGRESRLPSMSLHGLRHSHATALLAADIHPKIVQERLGHHSTAFTMDVYSSVLPSMQREAVERLADEVG